MVHRVLRLLSFPSLPKSYLCTVYTLGAPITSRQDGSIAVVLHLPACHAEYDECRLYCFLLAVELLFSDVYLNHVWCTSVTIYGKFDDISSCNLGLILFQHFYLVHMQLSI